jgi:zinc/manganese transport system substrate-binding protein
LHDTEIDLQQSETIVSIGASIRFARSLRLIVAALAFCASHGTAAPHILRVVATSSDLASLARIVGGDRVSVESLTHPEQDPHGIELKPRQLALAREAALVIRVGLDHEPWFGKLRLPASVVIVDASRNVRLLQTETPRLRAGGPPHAHAYGNTHYWLDPANALSIAAEIRDALTKLSPADAQRIESNRAAFEMLLAQKMVGWTAALQPYRGTKLVVMHDSWSYFADRFDLRIVAAAETHPGVPPSPRELAALVGHMKAAHVRLLVAEPSSNAQLVRYIAEATGAKPVILSASGNDYVRLIDENVAKVAAALRAAPR